MSEPVTVRPEGVTVTAAGRAAAAPDVLVLSLAAEVQDRGLGTALDGASRAMTAMVDHLRTSGVADRDLRTSGASLWSRTDEHGRVTWHVATERLTARLRDLSAAGQLLPAVVAAGGDAARIHGLQFVVDDDAAVTRAARADAWEKAQAMAAEHAGRAGRGLGRVRRVAESESGPVPSRGVMRLAAMESAPMPVEGGEQEVTVTIEVEWAFAD